MANFDGTEGGYIGQHKGRVYANNYRSSPSFTWNQGVKGHFIGREILEDMLSQTDAQGLRVYYGSRFDTTTQTLRPELLFVAADSQGEDILEHDKVADLTMPCPSHCARFGL